VLIITLFLFLINTYYVTTKKDTKANYETDIESSIDLGLFSMDIETVNVQKKLWESTINNVELKDIDNHPLYLHDILEKDKLILYFDESKSCPPCIEKLISLLQNEGNSTLANKVLIISNFKTYRDLKSFTIKHNLNFQCYMIGRENQTILDLTESLISFDQLLFLCTKSKSIRFPILFNSKMIEHNPLFTLFISSLIDLL